MYTYGPISYDNEPPSIWVDTPTDYGVYSSTSGAMYSFGAIDGTDSSPTITASLTLFDGTTTMVQNGDLLPGARA